MKSDSQECGTQSNKSKKAFRTISEASLEIGLPQHVLRFWETKFPELSPLKRSGGRRFYRPEDLKLLAYIKKLLHTDGYTIKGVQKIIKERIKHITQEKKVAAGTYSQISNQMYEDILISINDLEQILADLASAQKKSK
tara:strand:+ start:350 stop:766 length:417 start_codon:yes stop_codon:yes gene_type:complete